MKAGILVRVLCGLLMVFFLGSSTDEGCTDDTSTSSAMLNVSNDTSSGFTVYVSDGQSQWLNSGDIKTFNVEANKTYTVTTSTGLSASKYVGYTSATVVFQ